MDNIKEQLENKIDSTFNKLETLSLGSKEHSFAVNDLIKLYQLSIESEKVENECRLREEESRKNSELKREELEYKKKEYEMKERDAKDIRLDRYVRWGLMAAEIILPMMFYACWMRRGFKFEETGTFTSTTFRNLFNNFKPTKRK